MQPKFVLAALAALVAASSTSPATQTVACPNQKSRLFAGFDQAVGPFRRCKSTITIFEVQVQIASTSCPTARLVAGPHEECLGDVSLGTRCVDLGEIPVVFATCRCVTHGPGWLSISTCECTTTGWSGLLPNAGTFPCP